MNERTVSVKASPIGQDFQDALWGQKLKCLDISHSILTFKRHLVNDLPPGDLKYLYPIYFDAARVFLAECVAEFSQTGYICITALDPLCLKYAKHEIRHITISPEDTSQLMRVLHRVQEPAHHLYHKYGENGWLEHIQALCQTLSTLQ